ncbi:hypothetical protein B0H13DRAFT_1876365 [Mycena leptocephala]|nr:hypothetical protein B0H13DRAFT_1876365 [Mycena leptocephala]
MGTGNKTAPSKKKKKSTAAQKVAKLRNIPSNKENIAPSASTALPPQKPVAPPKDWKHEFQKLQRRHRYTKTRQKKLEAELAAFKLTDAATKHRADLARQRIERYHRKICYRGPQKKRSFEGSHRRLANPN